MESITMISWELAPFHTRGGTAYAIRRLANQLTKLGIKTRVLLPDWLDTRPEKDLTSLLVPMVVKMPVELPRTPGVLPSLEFSGAAIEACEYIKNNGGSDALIAHSAEGAMFIVLQGAKRYVGPSVFWLHSLFDPSIDALSKDQRRVFPSQSLLASAVMMADIVVTSTGILKDAQEFEWPARIKALQIALTTALAEDRVLTVESTGCLPENANDSPNELNSGSNMEILKSVPSPYVLFPGRPAVDKGYGFYAAIAERLRSDNIACVAVQRPAQQANSATPLRDGPVYRLPWLAQDELLAAMRNAACTVVPSITEGFGLAAAESVSQGVTTLYQQVGGCHSLEGLPGAWPIPLTTNEREQLYGLWSELICTFPADFWPVWKRHEISLKPLVDRWVEAIRTVVYRATRAEHKQFPKQPAEERWGNRLRRRIEQSTTLKHEMKEH